MCLEFGDHSDADLERQGWIRFLISKELPPSKQKCVGPHKSCPDKLKAARRVALDDRDVV